MNLLRCVIMSLLHQSRNHQVSGIEVKLERIRRLSSTTRDFRFVRLDNQVTDYIPGQFFRFRFEDELGKFERPYSLCNFEPQSRGASHLDLVISTVESGRASKLLWQSETGLSATVTGPFGRLLVPKKLPGRLFLVATSVGIAPYMPMLMQLSEQLKGDGLQVHFLYGTRDRSEFVYGESLSSYAADHPGFHLAVCYSRDMPQDKRKFEYPGYVQERLKSLSMNPATDHVLLCGNPGMIDEIYPWLKQLGFTVRQVVREKYVFAKEAKSEAKTQLTDAQKKLIQEKMQKYQR